MGFGILATIKSFAPWVLYLTVIAAFFAGLTGKVRWPLLVITFLLPLRNVVERLYEFPLGNQLLDILIGGMLIGWLISAATERKKFMERSSINGMAIVLVLYLTFTLLIGNNSLTGSIALDPGDPRVQDWKNFCLLPLLFFLTLNNITDRKWVWRVLGVMCFAMIIMAYYTVSQVGMFSALVSREKITGTFVFLGPNEVAAFLNQYTIILMSVYFFMKRKPIKLILLGLICVNLYCVLFLYSRAAYAGLAIGLFLLFLFKNRKLLLPLIMVLLLWQVVLPEKAIERIEGTKTEYGELDESSERRLVVWQKGLEIFKENSVVGIGFGVFRTLGYDLGDTHNIYVKILVEQGLVGLLIFLLVILAFMIEGFRLYKKGDDDFSKGLGLGLFVCMFVLSVNNFFGDRWSYFELSGYLWIFAGLVARLNIISSEENRPARPAKKKSTNLKNPYIRPA